MKNLVVLTFSLFFAFSIIQAQSNTMGIRTENTNEIKGNLSSPHSQLISIELRLDKLKGFMDIKISETKGLYENIQTTEDKIKLKSGLNALEKLNEATSFQEVISIASGSLHLESHEILSTDKEIIHYFVFSL